MGTAASGKKLKSDINITPYIDILLVLLIIFMVVVPVRQADLRARLPESPREDLKPPARSDLIVLSVGESAQISINRDPVKIVLLGSRLRDIYRGRPNKELFVSASPKLPYGDVVKVMDIAKGAGVEEICLLGEEMR